MSKDILRTTLNELLDKVAERLQAGRAAVWKSEEAVESARSHLEAAKSEKAQAINKNEDLRKKVHALMDHFNHLTVKPDVLRQEISSLNAQQSKAFNQMSEAKAIVEQLKHKLSSSELRLRMAEENCKAIEKEYQDVAEQIESLNT